MESASPKKQVDAMANAIRFGSTFLQDGTQIASASTSDEILAIGLRYLVELNDPERAFMWLDYLATKERNQGWPAFWLAYVCCYELPDLAFLERAESTIFECYSARGDVLGAAAWLLAEVRSSILDLRTRASTTAHDRPTTTEPFWKPSDWPWEESYLDLLRESCQVEPKWVINHQILADAYQVIGERSLALFHLRAALSNLRESQSQSTDPTAPEYDVILYCRESFATGRARHSIKADELRDQIRTLQGNSGVDFE